MIKKEESNKEGLVKILLGLATILGIGMALGLIRFVVRLYKIPTALIILGIMGIFAGILMVLTFMVVCYKIGDAIIERYKKKKSKKPR